MRLLEWQVVWSDDEIGWEEYGVEGQAHVAINRWDREEPLPAKSAIVGVLSVEDAYATTEALKAKGVRCAEVFHIPEVVTYGTFFDPDGNGWQFASSQG